MMIGAPSPRAALLAAVLTTLAAVLLHREHRGRSVEIRRMERRLEQLVAGNEHARGLAPDGTAELERRLKRHADRIARLEQLIPRSEEVPALLEALAAEARDSGLGDLTLIRPAEAESNPFYTRRNYEISVEGGYHQVARFLTAIASLPRIVAPMELEMTAMVGQAVDPNPAVRAHVRIGTYVRPPGAADTASTGPTGTPAERGR